MSNKHEDNFWDLGEYAKKKPNEYIPRKQFSKEATSAIEIEDNSSTHDILPSDDANKNNRITRFIPPYQGIAKSKRFVIKEYSHSNPLIKSIKVISDKEDDPIFPDTNLFIRERNALLHKVGVECAYTPYYSFYPRYSQMSRAQLKWYLWWRENAKKGNFLYTDESYISLYVYELAATGENEDKSESLKMLCSLMREYSAKKNNVVFGMMIRDIICDFCLIHELQLPSDILGDIDPQVLTGAYLPEFFFDLSQAQSISIRNLSLYDYRRSKLYTPDTSELFQSSIDGALLATLNDANSYNAILSFTEGVYGCVTAEHKPFMRMTNIVNRTVRLEIKYYQLSNVQSSITDATRYAENRLREHLGIKNKLNIMAINPQIKNAIDRFFDVNYPAMSIPDRRRKNAIAKDVETHEYDKLYDVPRTEFSAERAMEIEKESWSTTKILTETFSDTEDDTQYIVPMQNDALNVTPTIQSRSFEKFDDTALEIPSFNDSVSNSNSQSDDIRSKIEEALGEKSKFIELCKCGIAAEQRKFALSLKLSPDELADRINEVAVDIFGDIILENNGDAYQIIEDYQELF